MFMIPLNNAIVFATALLRAVGGDGLDVIDVLKEDYGFVRAIMALLAIRDAKNNPMSSKAGRILRQLGLGRLRL